MLTHWSYCSLVISQPLQWRHNGRDSVSNHRCLDCLLNRLFKRRSKKTSKLRVTGLCEVNSSVTGDPAQRDGDAENVPFDDVIMRNILIDNTLKCNVWRITPREAMPWRNCILLLVTKKYSDTSSHEHDDVIKWKHFPRYWPFVRGIHRSPVNSPHKGQWRGALMFTLICARINGWVNNREAGDLRRYRAHYDVIVMSLWEFSHEQLFGFQHNTACSHCGDVIISVMATQITSLTIVYATVCSGADQRKHQSSASRTLALKC